MGSINTVETAKYRGRTPGKIDASLNKELNNVEWGEYKLGDLFEIDNTLSFNTDKLVDGDSFDYVTRTSFNQGILQKTGFVNQENLNKSGVWSLGLLQMDFFYRSCDWYAGQFVRKIIPKNLILTSRVIKFFSVILNKQKHALLSVLVRNVDNTFRNLKVKLPTRNGKIDYGFMEKFIAELEAQRATELKAYLSVTGLKNYELTDEEKKAINDYSTTTFKEYNITKIFSIKNTKNILSREIVENSGDTPYLCASSENNAISSYISYDEALKDMGNCIFIGGKTFVVTYQEKDFFSNDSHNLVLYLQNYPKSKLTYLYLATCVYKSLNHKYSWGNSISGKKIQKDLVSLPTKDNEIDFDRMSLLISAIQKLVIKDVVLYADRKIESTKINSSNMAL